MRLALQPAVPLTARAGWSRLACVAGIAAMIAARIPGIWPHGRLWAEEGVVYLASAWIHPWYRALFTIHTGYLNLPASGITTLAVHLPARAR